MPVFQIPRVRIVVGSLDRAKDGVWINGERLGWVEKVSFEATRDLTRVTFTMPAAVEVEANGIDVTLACRDLQQNG